MLNEILASRNASLNPNSRDGELYFDQQALDLCGRHREVLSSYADGPQGKLLVR